MKQLKLPLNIPEGHELKFVSFITKNGKRIYAKQFGIKAFPIVVRVK